MSNPTLEEMLEHPFEYLSQLEEISNFHMMLEAGKALCSLSLIDDDESYSTKDVTFKTTKIDSIKLIPIFEQRQILKGGK